MKRFGVVLLALGLIAAFSTTVFAVDVKFSGEYYAAGMYLDHTTLVKDSSSGSPLPLPPTADSAFKKKEAKEGPSTAFYYQRLRVKTDFTVAKGLTLITRFDAMERAWGATRFPANTTATAVDSAGTVAENENIAFDWTYINYKSPIGVFDVGYMNYGTTGTVFGNNTTTQPRIKYAYTIGQFTINPAISKVSENDYTAKNAAGITDKDQDVYHLLGVYKWKGGLAGLNVNYYRYANNRTHATQPYERKYFLFTPYVIAKIGPVALQAEFNYAIGDDDYESPATREDADIESISGWVDATADFGKFYAGGSIAYVMGDVDSNDDKVKNVLNGGRDWNPCLIMFSYDDRARWVGNLNGYNSATDDGIMKNAWFFQARGGVRPVEKLDISASVSYAFADKKPSDGGVKYKDDDYGYEVDLTATYKITNNLSYMLGVGYLFTGDYYKGTNDSNDIRDDYLVVNKLTLTF